MKRYASVIALLLSFIFVLSGCSSPEPQQQFNQQISQNELAETTESPVDVQVDEEAKERPESAGVFNLNSIPSYNGNPYVVINDNNPYFTESDYTTKSFERYSPLDSLGRCGVAYANIGKDIMPTGERGSIGMVKPSGWHSIKYENVDGKYLYNRCHLIGYQLSAENANTSNLITGTRYLNIKGMLPFENMVADYVKETNNHVLYRVTPIFEGNNLLASGVLMEGYSVEDNGDGIRYNVYCYNVQPGIKINYSNGDSEAEDGSAPYGSSAVVTTPKKETSQQTQNTSPTVRYIGNKNTKKLHYPSCRSVDQMKDSNKEYLTCTREQALSRGYGINSYNDAFLSISISENPYDAISQNFEVCKEKNLIGVELKKDRILPEMFKYFGWCTWDACYHNVSSELLYKKLDEFKEKNIKVKWLLIDDGWSLYTSGEDEEPSALLSYKEDTKKFPEGLKACIKRIKEEYGVEYVGVWQSFTGYWKGVSKNSEIVKKYPESVTKIFSQRIFPAFDKIGAYTFWNEWHKYLKEQGVDFVKVDTQSSFNFKFISENMGIYEGLKNQYDALEKSVFENFGGRIINCMGMSNENCFARQKSALNRNSGDFLPKQENGFVSHCINNVYNVPYHSMLYHCDFDMWWSEHETAKQSAVLRAISGGPVYTSDEVGHSDFLYINPTCDENAKIYELDDFAKPTLDCYYVDCVKSEKPLKVFNRKGNKFVLAVFGVADGISKGELKLSDFGVGGSYIAEEYFSGELFKLDNETAINLSLEKNDCLLYNIYPVDENGEVQLGRKDKFIGIGTEAVRTIKACDI